MRRAALLLLIVAASAALAAPHLAERWAGGLFAVATALLPCSCILLGTATASRSRLRRTVLVTAGLGLLVATSLIALQVLTGSAGERASFHRVPATLWILLGGLWLVPLVWTSLGFLWGFETGGLDPRRLAARHAEGPASSDPEP